MVFAFIPPILQEFSTIPLLKAAAKFSPNTTPTTQSVLLFLTALAIGVAAAFVIFLLINLIKHGNRKRLRCISVKRQLTEEQSERLRLNDDHAKEVKFVFVMKKMPIKFLNFNQSNKS